jgi:hypothetical protein
MDVDGAIGDLYALPPADFTAARDELARELRARGERTAADEVKRLRRPNHPAWVVNRLAREEPELVEALLGAGGELRQAHRQASAGRGGARLRDAAEAEREAVDRLIAIARRLDDRAAVLERVRATLHVAAADDEVRAALAAGRLTNDAQSAGMWPLAAAGAAAPARRGGQRAKPAEPAAAPQRRAAERAEQQAREAELRRARAEERRLRKTMEAAARALETAEARYGRARAAADAAARAVEEQRGLFERAAAAHHEAARFIVSLEADGRASRSR